MTPSIATPPIGEVAAAAGAAGAAAIDVEVKIDAACVAQYR
eukprot:COSAG01_NODE_3133_length_6533_cov_117.587842_6_plen_41_part_00